MNASATLQSLRIVFLAGTLGQGGAERQLFYMLRTLRAHGARPTLLSLARGEYWEEEVARLGVDVQWVGRRRTRIGRAVDIVRAAGRLRPQLIQSCHFYVNLYAVLAGRRCGVPAIGAIRGDGLADVQRVGGALGRACLRWPDVVVSNSRAGGANATALGAGRLWVLPNVIDTTAFAFRARVPAPEFRVAVVARLSDEKRIDRLLRIVAVARPQMRRPLRVTIAGDGPLRRSLETQTEALGLADIVTFVGSVPDVRAMLAESDCLALTSDSEGTPNVILEAMAVGRAVLATDVGGVADVVADDRTGFVLARDDEKGFAHRLARLAEDEGLADRLGREARREVERQYSLTALPDLLGRLYGALLSVPTAHS